MDRRQLDFDGFRRCCPASTAGGRCGRDFGQPATTFLPLIPNGSTLRTANGSVYGARNLLQIVAGGRGGLAAATVA